MPKKPNVQIPDLSLEQIEEFWKRVEKRGEGECWKWTGSINKDGYGTMSVKLGHYQYRNFRATRIAVFLSTGMDPGELSVLHDCENLPTFIGRSCTNPNHLRAGTHGENMEYTRGRVKEWLSEVWSGDGHPNAKLTTEIVTNICHRRAAGETCTSLAKEFDIEIATVSGITTGKSWRHLSLPRTKDLSKGGGYKLTREDILEIRRLRGDGLSQQKISERMAGRANQSMISKILLGQYHRDVV